ncbi:MAG: U3 snoRNP protein [Candelina submexicana]|nr:MAG: U3 snoRNP protein [Candelina submexicana]
MSGASDKARFFLEQSVPELQELERKKIFTKAEITSIAKKRSDFEHKINARGSHPSDYARYVEFEMNLETLRRKRIKRLGVKSSGHTGQRRIFFVLDRATRKFNGDIGLWMQYMDFARKEKANKKMTQILTSVLRMHPTKPELWIYAAQYAIHEHADMTAARSYMQRGLRFCKASRALWLEFAKLEMIYISKIAARRKILGLDKPRPTKAEDQVDENKISLPELTAEDINPSLGRDDTIDEVALQNLSATPALKGAIPMVVFDTAMKQFQNDATLGERFFNMFAEFGGLPCLPNILQHVVNQMRLSTPKDASALACYYRQPVVGIKVISSDFPSALGISYQRWKSSLTEASRVFEVAAKAIAWLLPMLEVQDVDPGVRTVLSVMLKQAIRTFAEAIEQDHRITEVDISSVSEKLNPAGYSIDAQNILSKAVTFRGFANAQSLTKQIAE